MATFRIGTAGWSIPKQYASDLPQQGSHLERYSQMLPCAEINSSFYRSHRTSTWTRWVASVPEGFRFSVKAPKSVTHEARLACSVIQLKSFLDEACTLADKLGPVLFQLPPKLCFDPIIARSFFAMLRDLYAGPVALEPRHPSWFPVEAVKLLNKFQIAQVAADPAPVPEAGTPAGWNKLIYYRLHGSPRMYYSQYGKAFLQNLAAAIERQCDAAEVWCIFDNTAAGAALGDAILLHGLLEGKTCGAGK